MKMPSLIKKTIIAAGLFVSASIAQAALIQPDSATASSEFSGSFDIGNAIDGSGLPANFTVLDGHANYGAHNHWTTQANQVPNNSYATFMFDNPQTLYSFNLWNHRSNVIASNSEYAVTDFTLIFKDSSGATLLTLSNLTALAGIAEAQNYNFAAVSGVSAIDFIINSNLRFDNGNASPNYTGVAEVAFNGTVVPVPAAIWLFASALLGIMSLNRRQS